MGGMSDAGGVPSRGFWTRTAWIAWYYARFQLGPRAGLRMWWRPLAGIGRGAE